MAGSSPRRVLIYSGNMFNELPDVPYMITMEVAAEPDPMEVELSDGLRVAHTRLDHVPKSLLGDMIEEMPWRADGADQHQRGDVDAQLAV